MNKKEDESIEYLNLQTSNQTQDNIAKLETLFPNCVTESIIEGKIVKQVDMEMLSRLLQDVKINEGTEKYVMNWPMKNETLRCMKASSKRMLRPIPERSVNYVDTKNIYIEGDNFKAMQILRTHYLGKVKTIYIDPPYNTNKDFVYADDFSLKISEFNEISGEFDEYQNRLYQNTGNDGRLHTNWLNMMYPRLVYARDLLKEDGVIFISIDDHELPNLWRMCNDIFNSSNCLGCFPRVTKKAGKSSESIAKNHDYVLAFAKSSKCTLYLQAHDDPGFKYTDEFFEKRGRYKLNQTLDYDSLQYSPSLDYPIEMEGETLYPGSSYEKYLERKSGKHAKADWAWRWSEDLFKYGLENGFIVLKKSSNGCRIYTKTYQNARIIKNGNGYEIEYIQRTKSVSTLQFVDNVYSNDNSSKDLSSLFGKDVFDYSKPVSLIKDLIQMSSKGNDIIMDFFSGSATTAQAVFEANKEDGGNRKFILVQVDDKCPEDSDSKLAGFDTICQVGEERIRLAGKKISDSTIDTGFRVLRVDDTCVKDVRYAPKDLLRSDLERNISYFKPLSERSLLDRLFQALPEFDLPFSVEYTEEIINGKKVFVVNKGFLIACLEEGVKIDTITEIAKRHPDNALFCNDSMEDDSTAINCDQIFKQLSPETHLKIM